MTEASRPALRLPGVPVEPWVRRLRTARERAEAELLAAWDGLPMGRGGALRFRKWLGWKLFHAAARVNPDVADA